MHEITVADRLLDRAIEAAAAEGSDRIEELRVAVGEATHLNPTQLEFWLAELGADTAAAGATIEIRRVPAEGECSCGWSGRLPSLDAPIGPAPDRRCPECGATTSLTAGTECRLETITLPDAEVADGRSDEAQADPAGPETHPNDSQ